jgi:hypothetical protein
LPAPGAVSHRSRPAFKAPSGSASSRSRTSLTRCPMRSPSRSRFPIPVERDREGPPPAHPSPGGGPQPARAQQPRRCRPRRRPGIRGPAGRPRANGEENPGAGRSGASPTALPPSNPPVLTVASVYGVESPAGSIVQTPASRLACIRSARSISAPRDAKPASRGTPTSAGEGGSRDRMPGRVRKGDR